MLRQDEDTSTATAIRDQLLRGETVMLAVTAPEDPTLRVVQVRLLPHPAAAAAPKE